MEITELIIWSAVIFNFILSVIIAVGFISLIRLIQELEVKTRIIIKAQEKRINDFGADRTAEQGNIAKEEGKKDKLIGEARNIKKQMDILYVSGEDQYSINRLQEVLDQKNAEIEEQKALLDVLYAKRDKR